MFKRTAMYTSCLVAMPSFLTGYGRALDVAGTFDQYNASDSEKEADTQAIANDWRIVGQQLHEAIASK